MIAAMAKTAPRNPEVAEQFDLLADFLELEGADAFRVVAYRRAANRIRETPGSIVELARSGRAKELQGIGKTIEEKIVQVADDGEIHALTKRKAIVPPEVVLFMRLPGLGPKTARRIWQELGITTLVDLHAAAEQERLRGLTGLGARSEEKILHALRTAADKPSPQTGRRLLGDGLGPVLAVVATLREHPFAEKVSEAGSVRRRKETFRDLDIIATASDPAALTESFTKLRWIDEIAAKGATKATVISNDGLRFDLRVVPPESYGNLLQHFTGSKEHNLALREDAVRRGLSVSEYGITVVETGEVVTAEEEPEVYERFGYQFIPAELRENAGELEAARRGELPELVELGDLRGDLHSHSTWSSDGKNSVEEMAVAARERGYEYLALTDHSHYLREGRLARQHEEIDALNERLKPFRILKGIEVNIRANGEIDVDEETLAGLDWVMASIHSGFDRSPTERVLAAMDSPHVHCIGHLTGRKLNIRGPMEIDVERVVEKAVETGTFLEAGVRVVVSTDAHEVRALAWAEVGVAQARRAWLTRDQVLNTRTWPQIRKLLK